MLKMRMPLLLAAVIAAFAVTAAPAMAFKEFIAKSTGTIKDKNKGNHEFTTNGGIVVCTAETSEGKVTELKSPKNIETVKYSGCKFINLTATVSPAEYEFKATGTVSVLNTITVKVEGCTVTVEPTSNKELKLNTFTNVLNGTVKEVEIKAAVETITYKTSSILCGAGGKNGKYKGTSIAHLEGGNIEVA